MDVPYRLFYESSHHALQVAIDNNVGGKRFKEIAAAMYPAKPPASAYARLKAIVTEGSGEKADLHEVCMLCQITGRCDPLYWMEDELMHDRSRPRTPVDRRDELLREFNHRAEQMVLLAQEIREVSGRPELRVAK